MSQSLFQVGRLIDYLSESSGGGGGDGGGTSPQILDRIARLEASVTQLQTGLNQLENTVTQLASSIPSVGSHEHVVTLACDTQTTINSEFGRFLGAFMLPRRLELISMTGGVNDAGVENGAFLLRYFSAVDLGNLTSQQTFSGSILSSSPNPVIYGEVNDVFMMFYNGAAGIPATDNKWQSSYAAMTLQLREWGNL